MLCSLTNRRISDPRTIARASGTGTENLDGTRLLASPRLAPCRGYRKEEAYGCWFTEPANDKLAAQEGFGRYRRRHGSDFACRQSSEAVLTGSTSTVTSKASLPMFMLIEIRRHAKSDLYLLHYPQALVSAPESCVELNVWSA